MIHDYVQYVLNNIVSKYLFIQQLITRHTLPSVSSVFHKLTQVLNQSQLYV